MHINDLLATAVKRGASDLHMKVGSFPMLRIDGTLHAGERDQARSTRRTWRAWRRRCSTRSSARSSARTSRSTSPTRVPALGRFRCNVFQQRGTIGLVMRVIPSRVPTVDDLQLPPVLKRIAEEERGLVLVTGTTGSGKSTSLAAMLNHINNTRATHIMTVEDPIEYLHRDNKSIINQREVRTDTSRSRRRCAARCVRTPTSCWSAKCATSKRWKRRCWRPKRVTSCSRRCTRSTRPRASTASSRCSRRTSSGRCACSSRASSRRWSRSA